MRRRSPEPSHQRTTALQPAHACAWADKRFATVLAAGGPKVAFGPRVPEQWICLFEGRAGARARAVFATEEQARQFAEQHAQITATGMPLKWNDNVDPMVLTTPLGDYRCQWSVRRAQWRP
jgi:hypothetical protein